MSDLSRREFLRKSSMGAAAGAAVAGGLLGAGKAAAATRQGTNGAHDPDIAASSADATPAGEHIVAHVRKGEGSEIHLLVGEREIVSNDPQLVRRILRASRKK